MKRQRFAGKLCVYRESSQVEHLSAQVEVDTGQTFYYHSCPKAFDDLIVSGQRNVIDIGFVAALNGSNPRQVVAISEPR